MDTQNESDIKSGIYNKGDVELANIIESIKRDSNLKGAGSIHTFTGIVRDSSKTGKPVVRMKIDAYDDLANESIKTICTELRQEKGIIDIKIVHLKGTFELSEDLVYVVVASAHRREGFLVIEKAVERYKKEIAVWKREDYNDGSSEWVH
ncbi:MAG: molybdenum cofactor biosynthesis protein MoaE [Promethearchaeota archaeon]|jgi:molybdopterin synthase catalytic subunit